MNGLKLITLDSFPEELCWDGKKASTTVDQVEMFNSCFASIESSSLSSEKTDILVKHGYNDKFSNFNYKMYKKRFRNEQRKRIKKKEA
ncbi:hypothetical protein BpHYR1_054049 [Brachionus plicatilis]|uniref:Uncharacterized protein n=1 Tax=Brachionus plicatilis TaxID=10195 RepID=A0A3M7SE53_BRAPC|nr:hypothetical protein BpHYR1_054049 [Brachionus plicatilis]